MNNKAKSKDLNLKLNLGISISLPVSQDVIIPDYSTEPSDASELEDIEYNHEKPNKSNKHVSRLNSLQIMFTKNNLSDKEILHIKQIIIKLICLFLFSFSPLKQL